MSSVDDLVAFLNARYDEDLALIDACETSVGRVRAGEMYEDGSGTADRDDFPSYPWSLEVPELRYMARWHPRVTKVEVDAKRRIIAEAAAYSPELEHGDNGEWAFKTVLLLLALPYADHREYREEWTP